MSTKARLVGLVATLAVVFAIVALSGALDKEAIRDRFDGLGVAGPIAFIVGACLLSIVFVPGPLLAGASGLIFGTALGTPVSIVSATLAACLAFTISRVIAPDAVREVGGERVKRLAAWVERRGFIAVLYARLTPGLPYMAINYACGLTRLRLIVFAAATALGTAPRTFAYVALGGSFGDFHKPETIVAIAILVAMALGALVVGALTRGQRQRGP